MLIIGLIGLGFYVVFVGIKCFTDDEVKGDMAVEIYKIENDKEDTDKSLGRLIWIGIKTVTSRYKWIFIPLLIGIGCIGYHLYITIEAGDYWYIGMSLISMYFINKILKIFHLDMPFWFILVVMLIIVLFEYK